MVDDPRGHIVPQQTQHVAVFSAKNGFAEYAAFTIRVDGRQRLAASPIIIEPFFEFR
jgi:hypothetical protein